MDEQKPCTYTFTYSLRQNYRPIHFDNNSLSILDTPQKSKGWVENSLRYLGTKIQLFGTFVWHLYKGPLLFALSPQQCLKSAPKLCQYIFANNFLSILDTPLKSKGLGRELSQGSGYKNLALQDKISLFGAYTKDRYFFALS
jgi:hypothetical protein